MPAQAKIEKLEMVCNAVLKELVDYPDRVVVTSMMGGGGEAAVLTVRVDRSDYGKVIGKHGRNVDALRVILEAIAAKHRIRLMLEIDDRNDRRASHGG